MNDPRPIAETADWQAMAPDEFRIFLANRHPKFARRGGPLEGFGEPTPKAPAPAPSAPAAAPLPDSLDGLSTAALIDLAKSNPSGFVSIARPLLDRLTPSEIRTLRETDLPKFNAALREKYSGQSQGFVSEAGVDPNLSASEIASLSAREAKEYAYRNPRGFLKALGAKAPPATSTPLFETVDAATLWKPGQPMDLAKFQTRQEHEAARKHDPAEYLRAVGRMTRGESAPNNEAEGSN